jgi:hypothetical protein
LGFENFEEPALPETNLLIVVGELPPELLRPDAKRDGKERSSAIPIPSWIL